jgi:RHS repeat-associated protein
MMPPAKQMDPVMGIDIHIVQPPGPVPPLPIPHPFIGMVLDPMEFAPFIGATVKVHGMPAAIAGVECKCIPPHIPLGGMFVPPLPSSEGELFMGSATVSFDGDAASHMMHPAITCQSVGMPKPPRFNLKKKPKPRVSLMLPTSFVLPIPGAPPVLIGGPPTISLTALGMKLLMAGLGKAFKKFTKSKLFKKLKDKFKKAKKKLFKNMKPGFLKCKILKAEPVNSVTGEVMVEQSDFSIDGRIPIEWGRTWGSHCEYRGSAGNGWQTPADIRLEIDTDGNVLFFDGGPGATVFPEIPQDLNPPSGRPPKGPVENVVTELQDGARLIHDRGRLSVHTKEGCIYRFEAPRRNLRTHKNATITLCIEEIADEYDNYLRFVRDERGELVRIDESAGRAIIVTSHKGLIHKLEWSHPADNGTLRPLIRYEYDDAHNLVSVIDALDAPYQFFYKNSLLIQHKDRNGLSFYYEYDRDDHEAKCVHAWGDGGLYDYHFDFQPNVTTYTDSLGNQKSLYYDANNLPIIEVDGIGVVAKYEYDEMGRTTAVIDGNGNRTEYEYDDLGNLSKLTRADGSALAIEYDNDCNPVSVTDPNGGVWGQTWNDRHRLIAQITPLGNKAEYFYDGHGQLESVLDARGFHSRVKTDVFGNLRGFADPLGNVTRFETDVFGNVTKETSAQGRVTQYRYDDKSRLNHIVNPSGTSIDCDYDGEGNLTRYRDEAGHVTKLFYAGLGEVGSRVNADGTTVQYIRDTEEQLISVVNERGQKYELKRDLRGRIVEEIDYWGKSRKYTYDKAQNLIKLIDPLTQSTVFTSDELGRIITKTFYDGKTERFEYDSNGNLKEHENDIIKCTRIFDAENRLIEELQGDFKVESDYDELGNRVRRRSTIGNEVIFSYDGNNQVASVQINDEAPFQIKRDKDGFAVQEILAGQLKRDYEYSLDGLLTGQHIHDQGFSVVERKYEYDPVGNLTAKEDRNKGKTAFTYDPMGRVIKTLNPKFHVEEFLFDPAGDLLKSDHKFDEETGLRKSTYKETDYIFDTAGRLVERSGKDKQLKLQWDGNDRLVKAENETGQITDFGYDAQGRRRFKKTGPNRTEFQWDGEQLLSDKLNQFDDREFVYYPGSFEPLAVISKDRKIYYYQNDVIGLPQELCSVNGSIVWSATYEAFGNDTVDDKSYVSNPLRFQGQYYDEELGLSYNRFRYFEPNIGAFISHDPLKLDAGENIYEYAPNHWMWFDPLGTSCKSAAQLAADRARKAGWSSKCAATLTIGNRVFTGFSGRVGKLHPQLKKALDMVPPGKRKEWIGKCAEIDALNKALKEGFNPSGGISDAIRIGEKHGTPKPTCDSCQAVLKQFGIRFPEST